MGAVVIAGIVGAGFAVSRHCKSTSTFDLRSQADSMLLAVYKDEDVSSVGMPTPSGTDVFISAPPAQERPGNSVNKLDRSFRMKKDPTAL
jgi:hypothetical protein